MKRLFLVLSLAVVFLASCCNNNTKGAQKCDGKAEQNCEQKCDGKHDHANCEQKCDGKHDHANCEQKCDGKHDNANCEKKAEGCQGHEHGTKADCNHQHQHEGCNHQHSAEIR